jgi:hypothetical protein
LDRWINSQKVNEQKHYYTNLKSVLHFFSKKVLPTVNIKVYCW